MTLRPAPVQMPIASAYLCPDPDCGTVSNDSVRCPRCHSQVIGLAGILNRGTVVHADVPAEGPMREDL